MKEWNFYENSSKGSESVLGRLTNWAEAFFLFFASDITDWNLVTADCSETDVNQVCAFFNSYKNITQV